MQTLLHDHTMLNNNWIISEDSTKELTLTNNGIITTVARAEAIRQGIVGAVYEGLLTTIAVDASNQGRKIIVIIVSRKRNCSCM